MPESSDFAQYPVSVSSGASEDFGTQVFTVLRRLLHQAKQSALAMDKQEQSDFYMIGGYSLYRVANAQAQMGDSVEAQKTAEEIKEESLKATTIDCVASAEFGKKSITELHALTSAHLRRGDFVGIQQIIEYADGLIKDDIIKYVVLLALSIGGFAVVKQVINVISDDRKKIDALGFVAEVQNKRSDLPSVGTTILYMKAVVDECAVSHIREQAWEQIAVTQAKRGDFVGALQTVAEKAPVSAYILCKIAHEQVEAGDMLGAAKTISVAWQETKALEEDSSQVNAYSSIAVAEAQIGDLGRANKAIIIAERLAKSMRFAQKKDFALISIANAQAQIGDVSGAKRTVEELSNSSWKFVALRDMASLLEHLGDRVNARIIRDEATRLTWQFLPDSEKEQAIPQIANAQIEAGDLVAARLTAAKISGYSQNVRALCEIAAIQLRAGDATGAKATIGRAKQFAHSSNDNDALGKVRDLSEIAAFQIKMVDLSGVNATMEQAEYFLVDMHDPIEQLNAITEFVSTISHAIYG